VSDNHGTLGPRALNRALLARQLLLERASMPALDALEHLVGLQAQAPQPPYVGLWTRLERFDPTELADLIIHRRVVRIALQRGTIHAVSSRDALILRPLLQPLFDRWLRRLGPALGGVPLDAVAAVARKLLEQEPLTFAALGRRLGERWPDADPAALAQVARGALALVQTPPRGLWGRGGPARHTTIEAWLGEPLDRPGTTDELLLRYLAAFGPASVRDAQTWCGLTRLAEVAERLRPQLCTFRDESGRELFDLPDAPRPDPDTIAPVRFLPEWDNVLRSHHARSRVMSDQHRAALRRPNDVVPGTVLVDGFLAATWAQEIKRAAATLIIEPLRPLSQRETRAVAAEGRRLLHWSAPRIASSSRTVTVGPPPTAS
jgi:Winged helix DNA-binding domain